MGVAVFFVIASVGSQNKAFAGNNVWTTNGPNVSAVKAIAVSPNYATDRTIYAGTWGDGVFRSVNGEETWTNIGLPFEGNLVGGLAISPNYASDHTLYIGTVTHLYKFIDNGSGGGTTTEVNVTLWPSIPDIYPVAVSPNYESDRTVFAAVMNQGMYKISDLLSGPTATLITSFPTYFTSFVVSPNYAADHTLFAGTPGNGLYKVVENPSGAATRTLANAIFTDLQVSAVGISPSYAADQTVFAGTIYGVIVTNNNFATVWPTSWAYGSTYNILSIAVSPNYAADRTVFAGTAGKGVIKSTDGGATWTQVNVGFSPVSETYFVDAVAVVPNYSTDPTIFSEKDYNVWSYSFAPLTLSSTITAPRNGATLRGITSAITGTASGGPSGLSKVEVSINAGAWQTTTGTTSWSYPWTLPSDGIYSLQSRATNTQGNQEVPGVGIRVVVDNTRPASAIAGVKWKKIDNKWFITVYGTAADGIGSGVSRVEVGFSTAQIGGLTLPGRLVIPRGTIGTVWKPANGTNKWSYTFSVPSTWTKYHGKKFKIQSRAKDRAGNLEVPGPGISATIP